MPETDLLPSTDADASMVSQHEPSRRSTTSKASPGRTSRQTSRRSNHPYSCGDSREGSGYAEDRPSRSTWKPYRGPSGGSRQHYKPHSSPTGIPAKSRSRERDRRDVRPRHRSRSAPSRSDRREQPLPDDTSRNNRTSSRKQTSKQIEEEHRYHKTQQRALAMTEEMHQTLSGLKNHCHNSFNALAEVCSKILMQIEKAPLRVEIATTRTTAPISSDIPLEKFDQLHIDAEMKPEDIAGFSNQEVDHLLDTA